jgi:hypothetical protein
MIPPVFSLMIIPFVSHVEGKGSQDFLFEGRGGTAGLEEPCVGCVSLMTVPFLSCRVARHALMGGCAAGVSPREGESTPDWIAVLADTPKWASGFVAGRVPLLVIDFVLTTFVGSRRLETIGGNTCVGSSLDVQADVARIEVTGDRLGSIWPTLGAGKRLCTLSLVLTTVLTIGCLVIVSASLGGCERWISPREGETAWLGGGAEHRVVKQTAPGTTIRYVPSVFISAFGLTTFIALCRSVAIRQDGLTLSLDG